MVRVLLKTVLLAAAMGIYTLAACLGFVYLLFPREGVRAFVESEVERLHPALDCRVAAVEPGWDGLRLRGIVLGLRGRERQDLLEIPQAVLGPRLDRMLKTRSPVLDVRARLAGGRLRGVVRADLSRGRVEARATLQGLRLERLGGLLGLLGREAEGELRGEARSAGSFEYPARMFSADLEMVEGRLSLQQQVLGMKELPFTRIAMRLERDGGVLKISSGEARSRLLLAEFGGRLIPAADPLLSRVEIEGTLEPRPELLAGLGKAMQLVRSRLQNNRIPFAINGNLAEPGITMQGLERLP